MYPNYCHDCPDVIIIGIQLNINDCLLPSTYNKAFTTLQDNTDIGCSSNDDCDSEVGICMEGNQVKY